MTHNSFLAKLQEGKAFESRILAHLRQEGNLIADVSDMPEFQKIGVDAVHLLTSDGRKPQYRYLEFKAEGENGIHKWHNFFIEDITNKASGKAGWYRTSHCELLYYGNWITGEVHIMNMEELRRYIEANKDRLKYKEALSEEPNGYKKISCGYILPVEEAARYLSSYRFIYID